MKNLFKLIFTIFFINLSFFTTVSCGSDDSNNTVDEDTTDSTDDNNDDDDDVSSSELHAAWAEFDEDETDIYLEDGLVVIETTGDPNHTSYYWGEGHELFNENYTLDPDRATPTTIPERDNSATYYFDPDPEFADDDNLTETSLNTIGVAVSGAAIFNDQEGTGPLNTGVASGLDWSGAHIGPGVYHYHLEPQAFSNDDTNLVGVLFDGYFIYGRRCISTATDIDDPTDATYPTDLDEFYGHTHATQHSEGEEEYHYHVQNDIFLDQYYIIKDGYYRGNPLNVGEGRS